MSPLAAWTALPPGVRKAPVTPSWPRPQAQDFIHRSRCAWDKGITPLPQPGRQPGVLSVISQSRKLINSGEGRSRSPPALPSSTPPTPFRGCKQGQEAQVAQVSSPVHLLKLFGWGADLGGGQATGPCPRPSLQVNLVHAPSNKIPGRGTRRFPGVRPMNQFLKNFANESSSRDFSRFPPQKPAAAPWPTFWPRPPPGLSAPDGHRCGRGSRHSGPVSGLPRSQAPPGGTLAGI